MNTEYRTTILSCLTLAITVFSMAGCASTGLERSEKVQTNMEAVNENIKEAAQQLEATESSLENLVQPGQSDVEKAFNEFTENVSKIERIEEDFAAHAEQMRTRGNDYFEEWEKEGDEYENDQIQQLSEQRRMQLEKMYDQVTQNSIEISEAFNAYVTDVKEVQSYLSNDLTPKGLKAIAPTTQKVTSEGDSLKQAIRSVQSAIQKARMELAHTRSSR